MGFMGTGCQTSRRMGICPPASNQTHTFARQTSFAPPHEGPRTSSSKSTKELTMWVSLVSGCAVSRSAANRVWLHNDAGNGAPVIPIDARSGSVGRPVKLNGVEVFDPEDMAITNGGELVLADIGDNSSVRASIQLDRFREPALDPTTADVTQIDLRYPDGAHNAEAMLLTLDASAAVIFTKERNGVSAVFMADLNATTEQVRPLGDMLRAPPKRFDLPPMVQGEALCASPDGRTLFTASESRGSEDIRSRYRARPGASITVRRISAANRSAFGARSMDR